VNTAKATLPHLIESIKKNPDRASGRIVFISATLHYTGFPLQTHAAVAKSGVDALSANIAIEYGPLGVTSNAISPGPIGGTEGVRRLSKSEAQARSIPLGRFGSVKDIADATVYLFADSGNYVNGDVLVVDGGAWRTLATISGADIPYPDVVIRGSKSKM
jgi:peroxisomal 2,4-dienoyl-CoA reductase